MTIHQQRVDHNHQRIAQDGSGPIRNRSVDVNPTSTDLSGWIRVNRASVLSVTLRNPDVAQTINGVIEVAPESSVDPSQPDTSSVDTTEWAGLSEIAPLESRTEQFSTVGYQFARVSATASGAGITGAKLWIYLVDNIG